MKAKQLDTDAVQQTDQNLMVTASGDKMLEVKDTPLKINKKANAQVVAENYEEQYDANADFAVFGVGDKTKGGLQSLKEKMNLADGDKLDGAESSESYSHEQEPRSTTNKSSSSPSPPPDSPKEMKIYDQEQQIQETKDNQLPEDQEIYDASD